MKYSEEQKREINDISDIAKNVHEPFRVKCFEVLLNHWVGSSGLARPEQKGNGSEENPQGGENSIPRSAALNAFINKQGIDMEDLERVVYINDQGDVEFHEDPPAINMASSVVQWVLLRALRNVIIDKSFSVAPADLQVFCKEKGCYDSNFWGTLKQKKNSLLFTGLLQSGGEPKALSTKGKSELASLIRRMAGSES